MRKLILLVLSAFTAVAIAAGNPQSLINAQANAIAGKSLVAPNATQLPVIVPPSPDINAKGYVLLDANSGKIIASKNMHKQMQPASLTKLMTLYVTFQALAQGQVKLSDPVRISKTAWQRGGSRMFLKLGSHIPLQELIRGIITASGNDACVATAEYIAGKESSFAELMNQTAARLGMKDSHFDDSTGLPKPGHLTTPYDLAILTRAIIQDFPQYYHFFNEKWITFNGIRQANRNRLLWRDTSVDGLKTGHTEAAGYCLVSSALRNDMRLISVVMGTPTDSARANDSQALLNWGFRFYKSYKIVDATNPIATPRVWLGQNKHVPMGLSQSLYVTIPAGEYKNLKATMDMQPKIKAPVQQGQRYGSINITVNDKLLESATIIALQNDPKGSLWSRFTDHIALFFRDLF